MVYETASVKKFGVLGPTVSSAKKKIFSFTQLREKMGKLLRGNLLQHDMLDRI